MNKNIFIYTFLLVLVFSIGCKNIQHNEVLNVALGTQEYSLGKNRVIFSIIAEEEFYEKKNYKVKIRNTKNKTNSPEIDTIFYNWPNKSKGFYSFTYNFNEYGEYEIDIYELENPNLKYTTKITTNEIQTPIVGEVVPNLNNKTIFDNSDLTKISSDPDLDPDFYSQKFSDAINTKQPVIVFFISPNFCKTATCFPQLDVIKRLKHVYDDKIIYIHVEVYENPHLIKGNLQNAKISDVLNEWNIKSEPYTFLIKNKKLVSKFQGYVSYEEIDNDIDKILDVN